MAMAGPMAPPYAVGTVVEWRDGCGWRPAVIVGVRDDGTYDVSTELEERVHVGDVLALLCVLCRGSRARKLDAAMALYARRDRSGALVVSHAALAAYLTSVFHVLFETQPETRAAMDHASALDLGRLTADRAFQETATPRDRALHVDTLRDWYCNAESPTDEEEGEAEAEEAGNGSRDVDAAALVRVPVDMVVGRLGGWLDHNGHVSASALLAALRPFLNRATAVAATRALFDAFDVDGDGTIAFAEVGAGLHVVCGASASRDKARAAFDLFDEDGDGHIDADEMARYLRAVFRVAYASSETPPADLSPDELAVQTTLHVFETYDVNHDGELSFAEFERWYRATGPGGSGEDVEQLIPLEAAMKALGGVLQGIDSQRLCVVIEQYADRFHCLCAVAFENAFLAIFPQHATALRPVLLRAFSLFDADGDGTVDAAELAAGLSVLCGGGRDEKARAAFSVFDVNGDGHIDRAEMARYLRAVFRVAFASSSAVRGTAEATPDEIALATTDHIFQTSDLNGDGVLSFEEFSKWYSSTAGGGEDVLSGEAALRAVSELLAGRDPNELFAVISQCANDSRELSPEAFLRAFDHLFGEKVTAAVVRASFALFDSDGDGTVDAAELASGLAVLCGGSRDDKVRMAFALFDSDGDGLIDARELRAYLSAVFKVQYSRLSPGVVAARRAAGDDVSAEDLAAVTATSIMAHADANGDGKISFIEFDAWFSRTVEAPQGEDEFGDFDEADDDADTATAGDSALASDGNVADELAKARWLLNLEHFTLDELVEMLAEAAPRGAVSADAFARVAARIARLGGNFESSSRQAAVARHLARRIYAVFDDGAPVDFVELASGLSILCSTTMEEKIEAAFALYDISRGRVSFDEVRLYLLAVYRVLAATSPTLAAVMDAPGDIATATAQQCFATAQLRYNDQIDVETFRAFVLEAGPCAA
ncbi:hypothetical protein M885DRAFT_524898 [Pelagophyceae sp. CCMP2097]|nr:hypothetical protein M885DRAFT_524898 [Pelagophyceae sp. CCMP2097]